MRAKLFQSCPTLCDPMNYSPPCSSVHGILQARIWESRLPCPSPGDLPEPGIKPRSLMSPALASRFFTASTTGKPPFLVQKQDLRFFFPIFSSQWFHWGQGKEKEQCDQRKEKGLLRFVIQPCVICYKRHELLSWLKFQCFKKIKVISSDNINFPYDTPSLVVQFTLNTSSNGNSQTLEAILILLSSKSVSVQLLPTALVLSVSWAPKDTSHPAFPQTPGGLRPAQILSTA